MDCTPDLSHNEQLSVVLRIVNCNFKKGIAIHKHCVGFLLAHDTTGKGPFEIFLGHLEKLGLNLANCHGQSYDNGSNMQGKNQGVQKRVLDLNSKALCVPCGSHTLNLVGDAAKSSVASVSLFGLLQRLYSLFSSSVHRWTIIKDHVKTFTVKALSTTRWECRIEAVKAVRYQFPDILKALTALEDHAKEKRDEEDLQGDADMAFSGKHHCMINKVSKLLQSPTVSVDTFRRQITAVTGFLQEFREMGFNSVKTDAREIAEEIEVEMSWPEVRKRRAKRHFEYEGGEETQGTAEEIFKREVFLPLVDTALVTVKERFSHMETFFQLYGFLYSKDLMKSTKEAGRLGECCQKLEQATEDVEAQDLRLEVEGAVQSFPTDISTPSDMLNHIYKENIVELYPNLSIALRPLLTLPVNTVASGERSFSKLKLIKTYLRTTTTQERLSSLAVLSIEQEMRKRQRDQERSNK
ncbi:Zinc finger MYM-type protein 1 [Merluccius polli]|uniref:Zinc finger MYM-type protein 1 n=1 Tax=Merluccius polli TaxID=89951 RepID=A0AA47LZB8_MERPO|nr:Zinc finger MYM-type protein 1 [Merluccius polli]